MRRIGARRALLLSALLLPRAAFAGPPFLTDDPEPTDTGHWEVYGPLLEAEGNRENFEGGFGAEVNYGAAKDIQLTLGWSAAYTHDASGLLTSS